MVQTDWKIEGMTCSNCALTISKYLEKEGLQDIKVNPLAGELSFKSGDQGGLLQLKNGIENLGYRVVVPGKTESKKKKWFSSNKQRFLFCLPFTLVLMLHMLDRWLPIHWLMNPWVQLLICLPVFFMGMWFFGRSALRSLRNGMPNMNMLITLGALASFIYSLWGAIGEMGSNYMFFETTATIITLVFFGNYLEELSVASTQKAIRSLTKSQKVMANLIAFDDHHKEQIFSIENSQLHKGDLILIKNGEQVPADCKILWGECRVNESLLTGESMPVTREKKGLLIGGSLIEDGIVKAQVTATGNETILSSIVQMVQSAQSEKPPMQKLADKISAIFVPVVIGIAVIAFGVNFYFFDQDTSHSLMRAVAVLVIACPCAMGIATPAGIAVGLGRAAKSGILFRNASALESFKTIRQVVFDKTGTLTTGNFSIRAFETSLDEMTFKLITYSLEKYSNHPIAKVIEMNWRTSHPLKWKTVEELKGIGMRAEDAEGNIYEAGSFKILPEGTAKSNHNIYVLKNKVLIGWIDIMDEVRPEAKEVVRWLHSKHIKTIMLSGDRLENCLPIAKELGIEKVYAEQLPAEKLNKVAELNRELPTAMVGDGINDAPALAKATLGISLSEATQLALQSADVILMNHGLKKLPKALGLGKHTYMTIRQNLFWAFIYNIVAIPIAAIGLLSPGIAAFAMGFSDVVLAVNSSRLFVKKVL